MKEIWKDIDGYEGLYQISNLGRVKSLKYHNNKFKLTVSREKILKPCIHSNYYCVILTKNKNHKNYSVHRLVAQAFIPNPKNLPCVNHKDENKLNNEVSNLEWCTYKYNSNYGIGAEKAKTIAKINIINNSKAVQCVETGVIYKSAAEAERLTGIRASSISQARNGKYKTAGGFHWKFKN